MITLQVHFIRALYRSRARSKGANRYPWNFVNKLWFVELDNGALEIIENWFNAGRIRYIDRSENSCFWKINFASVTSRVFWYSRFFLQINSNFERIIREEKVSRCDKSKSGKNRRAKTGSFGKYAPLGDHKFAQLRNLWSIPMTPYFLPDKN